MITSQSLDTYSVGVDASVDGAVRSRRKRPSRCHRHSNVAVDVDVKVDVGVTVYMKTSRKLKTTKQVLTLTVV